MEFSPFDRSPEEDVLNRVFPHPDLADFDGVLLDEEVAKQIHPSYNLINEEVIEAEKMRRKLFGDDYGREYHPQLRHPNRRRR